MNAVVSPRAFEPSLTPAAVARSIRTGPHRIVDVGHSRVATWRFGRGPDLVFVHGWPLHAATFRNIVPALAEHFTCHLLDLPFVGRTETDPETRLGMRDYADTIFAAVEALGLRRFGLLAHDSGGAMARHLAAAHPDRVAALVLGNTEIPGHVPWQVKVYAATVALPGGEALLRWSMRIPWIRDSSLAFGGCFADPASVHGDFGALFVQPLVAGEADGQMELLHQLSLADLRGLADTHAKILAPTLLVWGALDPFFPLERMRARLGEFAGGATLHAIPDGKLLVHEDRPEAFVAAALPFLQRNLG